MKISPLQEYRGALEEFTERSDLTGTALLLGDCLLYGAFIVGTQLLDSTILRLLCSIGAGTAISSMFVLGHDAAHGVLTAKPALNRIYGRLAFLPSLHNYSLWVIAHNKMHHVEPNFKGRNSWSPLSKSEFDAMPAWRRWVERLYRSPGGLGIYYFFERWWADKFFPRTRCVAQLELRYWADFGLLLAYLTVYTIGLYQLGSWSGVLFGFVLPFVVWNYLIGFTVLMQHTNPNVPWFSDREQWSTLRGQQDVTVWVRFPRLYGWISHEVMEHTAHHVSPMVPCYHLFAAQQKLHDALGDKCIEVAFTPTLLFKVLAKCKLYDYDSHRWLDFRGTATSGPTVANPGALQVGSAVV